MLPKPTDIEGWIAPQYAAAYRNGTLHEQFCQKAPFKHVVLSDFFRKEVLDSILAFRKDLFIERARTDGIARHATWYWGAFGHLEVVRFVFGKTFRQFLNTLMGEELTMKATSTPQYNVFKPGSKGLPIHNDYSSDRSGVVCLLQLTEGHYEGAGGELNLFEKVNGQHHAFRRIAPVANTLILFKVSKDSWHSVSDMNGTWTRENVAFDWYFNENQDVA